MPLMTCRDSPVVTVESTTIEAAGALGFSCCWHCSGLTVRIGRAQHHTLDTVTIIVIEIGQDSKA